MLSFESAKLMNYPKGNDDFPQVLKAADQALKEEEDVFRRAAKAKVKAEQAAKTFERILNGKSKNNDRST
ncbi:MAG: hypothetical protein K8S13_09440 [Desulfobacula sp.]|uniref:hypothetical protein n=1 Tax=Desulfobacula sp. TaxID=2593537 RepID=UPI0025C1824A|nr:hypothetical protein [Desulfobacula sp.]MCD4720066.1 hypothetical protein [Desulfobacula sp.]